MYAIVKLLLSVAVESSNDYQMYLYRSVLTYCSTLISILAIALLEAGQFVAIKILQLKSEQLEVNQPWRRKDTNLLRKLREALLSQRLEF